MIDLKEKPHKNVPTIWNFSSKANWMISKMLLFSLWNKEKLRKYLSTFIITKVSLDRPNNNAREQLRVDIYVFLLQTTGNVTSLCHISLVFLMLYDLFAWILHLLF